MALCRTQHYVCQKSIKPRVRFSLTGTTTKLRSLVRSEKELIPILTEIDQNSMSEPKIVLLPTTWAYERTTEYSYSPVWLTYIEREGIFYRHKRVFEWVENNKKYLAAFTHFGSFMHYLNQPPWENKIIGKYSSIPIRQRVNSRKNKTPEEVEAIVSRIEKMQRQIEGV